MVALCLPPPLQPEPVSGRHSWGPAFPCRVKPLPGGPRHASTELPIGNEVPEGSPPLGTSTRRFRMYHPEGGAFP
eukprot:5451628-Alexandrium_andersonii.AAC.1